MLNTHLLSVSLVFLFNLTFSLQHDKHSKVLHPNHEFIAGRTMEYLPDPIFYDTYVPIMYKFPIPKLADTALRLDWGSAESCNSSKISPSGHICPISYHLFQVVNKLGDDMGFWKPYYVNHTLAKNQSMKKRTGFEVVCNEISQHFFRSYTSNSQLKSYLTALKACSRIGFQTKFREPTDNWVVNKNVYYKMLQSFKNEYFSILPEKDKVDWASTLNVYTAVHGLLLTNHVMESVRLATAHRICQSGLIPETFINMDMFKQALKEVKNDVKHKNYQLVYNNLEEDIEEYYKLPLADCTFSDDYSFIIRILVPIRRNAVSHRLVEINTIPFLEELSESSGIPTRLCRLKLVAPKITLIESSTGLLLDTSCESNQLCKTSEVSTVFENDACTSSLLQDNRELIKNACKFNCFSVSSVTLPLIQRVSPDTYVVVGSSEMKINLTCFNKPKELIEIKLRNVGAMRIKLACDCQLLYADHVSYRPRDPCGKKTEIVHILPYHWHKLESINKTLDKYEAENTTENPGNPESSNGQDERKGNDDSNDNNGNSNENTTEGRPESGNDNDSDNGTTPESTGDVDDAKIQKSLEEQEKLLGNKFEKPKKHDVVFKKLEEIPTGLVIQLCMLWTLVIILLFCLLVLGYHVYQLLKWKELQRIAGALAVFGSLGIRFMTYSEYIRSFGSFK